MVDGHWPPVPPLNGLASIRQGADLTERVITDLQGRYELACRLGANLATAVDSLAAARKNKARGKELKKWEDLLVEALSAYRTHESGQFYNGGE